MVHPLNELKDVKKATAEARKIRKAAAGVPVTRDELDEILEAFRAEIHDQLHEHLEVELAPIRGALEIDELDQAIGELPDPETVGDPDAGEDA